MDTEDVKKCSRCKTKRTGEPDSDLSKWSTCARCRAKRKIPPASVKPIDVEKEMQNTRFRTVFRLGSFLESVSNNSVEDIYGLRLVEINKDMPPYTVSEIESQHDKKEFYSHIAHKVSRLYIDPISLATGYKFVVRDYHKGGLRRKKVSLLFICAQDKTRQRQSRSNAKRNVSNRLKVHNCFSSINLYYDLLSSKVVIHYSHNCHPPIVDDDPSLHPQVSPQPLFHPHSALNYIKSPSVPRSSHSDDSSVRNIAEAAVDELDTLNIDNRLLQ